MGTHRGPQKRPKKGLITTASPLLRDLFALADAQGYTRNSLAAELDVTSQSVGMWRLGRNTPSVLQVEELAVALGVRLVLERDR